MAMLRCWVWSISQNDYVNTNYIVNTDLLPIQGLDPDLKVYGEHIPYPPMEIDSEISQLGITQQRLESPHPLYPSLLTYQITYSEVLRPQAELLVAVDNREALANDMLAQPILLGSKRQRYNKLLHKKVKGLSITQDESDFMDSMDELADAMQDNADNAESIKEWIIDHPGETPDITTGWTTSLE